MAEYHPPLASIYKGWDIYQHHLVTAIAPLSPEQLALHATSDLRSIGMIATHIIGVRAGWLYHVLKEGDEDLVTIGADRPTGFLPAHHTPVVPPATISGRSLSAPIPESDHEL